MTNEKTQSNEPNWTETIEQELTEIPPGGWMPEHIGEEVVLQMPFGTIVNDRIIRVDLGHDALIGPSLEIGMLLARQDYIMQAQQAYQAWADSIRDALDGDLE